ncbi:hypothetical protein ACFX1W_022497 [Malus domestica]
MTVDTDPFPSATVGMVDARLPKSKGKEKVEFAPVQHILKQSSQPRLKIDLFSNAPPTKLLGPAIVESMLDSSEEETTSDADADVTTPIDDYSGTFKGTWRRPAPESIRHDWPKETDRWSYINQTMP